MAAAWTISGMPVYAMTKAALRNLSQTLAPRPARQRRAGKRDRAGPGRDRRAPCPARGPRGRSAAFLREGFECLVQVPIDIAEAVMFRRVRRSARM